MIQKLWCPWCNDHNYHDGCHFPDEIFLYENEWILIKISLKFVPKGPINKISALVEIMEI